MLRFLFIVIGFFVIPVLPASLGLAIELTFPLSPVLINGTMMMLAQITAALQSITYSTVMDIDHADFASQEEETEMR